jgi:hypothetical protein
VITDYKAGEPFVFGGVSAVDAVGLTGPFGPPEDPWRVPVLNGGEYATFRGASGRGQFMRGQFTVDPDGGDLLVMYTDSSHSPGLYFGATAFLGITDFSEVLIG